MAPATADRVRRAIDILGYRPNLNARALKRGRTELLGLVLPDSTNPFFAELAHAVQEVAELSGQILVMANHGQNGSVENRLVEDLVARGADHIVIASAWAVHHLSESSRPGAPTVLVDCPAPVRGYRTIGPESETGAYEAVRHLLVDHGHDTVGLALGESGQAPENRERGWRRAHRDAGRRDGPIARQAFSYPGGYRCGLQLLDLVPRPTAILASSDLQAFGVLRAIGEHGLTVPDDIALISFDGTVASEYIWPPLTVVRQPTQQMAAAAVRTVMQGYGIAEQHQAFPMELVRRRSCGCDEREIMT